MSIYTRWERLMILCPTRKIDCNVEVCKLCNLICIEDKEWADKEEQENE